MKEIIDRLTENRQIELAKSILESSGYKVSKKLTEDSAEEHEGWVYNEDEVPPAYSKSVDDVEFLISPPNDIYGHSANWCAYVNGGPHDTEYTEGFESFEEAEEFIKNIYLSK